MDSHRTADSTNQKWAGATPEEEDGIALAIDQPHAWQGLTPVEMPWDPMGENQVLLDSHGHPVPFQVVPGGTRIVFVASVPKDGHATYRLVRRPPHASPYREVFASDTEIDNMDLRLELDPHTGTPTSLVDRRTCDELLDGPGWVGGGPALAGDGDLVFHAVRTACTERGPVRSTLRSESCLRGCRVVQEFRLYRYLPWVEVTATVEWETPRELLSLGFVTAPGAEETPCSTHSSRDEAPAPGFRWVDLSRPHHLGLAIIHGKGASAQVCGGTIRVEMRRDPPGTPLSTVRYALLPHAGDWRAAGVAAAAALLDSCATVKEETTG